MFRVVGVVERSVSLAHKQRDPFPQGIHGGDVYLSIAAEIAGNKGRGVEERERSCAGPN